MDRTRPVYVRQRSNSGGTPSSPSMSSPMHHHLRSGSVGMGGGKKAQNTKAAAQRLAHVMAHKSITDDEDEDEDDDDLSLDLSGSGGIGLGGSARPTRPRSPVLTSVRPVQEPTASSARPISVGGRGNLSVKTARSLESQSSSIHAAMRPFPSINSVEPSASSAHPTTLTRPSPSMNNRPTVDQATYSLRSSSRSSQPPNSVEQPGSARSNSGISSTEQPYSLRASAGARSSQSTSTNEQPNSARSITSVPARPQLGTKPAHMVPASVPISLRSSSSGDTPAESRREAVPVLLRPPSSAMLYSEGLSDSRQRDRSGSRLSMDIGSLNLRDTGSHDSSALQDELDMLQDENDGLHEKLRLAEERCEETEGRARQLEKQVATLGEGVTLEARLLSRKGAALQQREAALRVAAQTHDDRNDETESELQTIRMMTQRMILTSEEKEDVVLKRSWLARYWSLCVDHDIYGEIAKARYEYWSTFAPLPLEVVLDAGKKARDQTDEGQDYVDEGEYSPRDLNELSGDGNIEYMLLVEQGLRELAVLKVEDAVALAMAQHRQKNAKSSSSEGKQHAEGQFEGYELNKEETDDVFFKQAWLTYFWRRAKNHGLEADIADDRLQFWMNRDSKTPTSHDAVDVERGLMELRKLAIEIKLWENSRRDLEHDSIPRTRPSDF